MPKLVSSKKRMRQERVRQKRNIAIKSAMRTAIKKARQATDSEAFQSAIKSACSHLDRAAKRGVLHRRAAARHKSRLMKLADKQD